jgi:anti-anti-sigma factor
MQGNIKLEMQDIASSEIKLVKITGELDVISADSFRQTIGSYIDSGFINLIFDLENLRFIDSIGNLGLVNAYMNAKRKKGEVKFFGINENIKEVLDVIGTAKIIPIYESLEAALLDFKK